MIAAICILSGVVFMILVILIMNIIHLKKSINHTTKLLQDHTDILKEVTLRTIQNKQDISTLSYEFFKSRGESK